MFSKVCQKVRNSVYGINGLSQIGVDRVNCTNGTAFMIAPGFLVSAAHLTHVENDVKKPVHSIFEVIRAPDIGQGMEKAYLVGEDPIRDIAIFKIDNPRSNEYLSLEPEVVQIGTKCGSLGFPLAQVIFGKNGRSFNLIERFQGANISAFLKNQLDPSGRRLSFYETDSLMYAGSSGCPGFLINGNVFGMHVRSMMEKAKTDPNNLGNNNTFQSRVAISLWIPSIDIIDYAKKVGVKIDKLKN